MGQRRAQTVINFLRFIHPHQSFSILMKIPLTRPGKAKRLDRRPYRTVSTVDDVLAISAAFHAAGIPFYVHGGWALAGYCSTTFQSSDIDLYVPAEYEKVIEDKFGGLIQARTRKRVMLNFQSAVVEISFLTPLRDNRWVMDFGIKIWIIPQRDMQGHHITISGVEIPSVSKAFVYAELTNTLYKNDRDMQKHRDRAALAEAIMTDDERARSRSLWPLRGTFLNRLRIAITG